MPALELLVHGVGGATPQEMLGDPGAVRVTGDRTAAIHRAAEDLVDRPWDDERPVREAYTWSNLTSGNGARALWLLLLPFMIVNMAHWMRPAAPGHGRSHRWYDVLIRLTALSLTVLLVAGACVVTMDLLAWQCFAAPLCAERSTWFRFLAESGGWWSHPGRRLALTSVLPVLLVGLLWWLSRRTWSAYESAYPPVRLRADGGGDAQLGLPGFWYGRGVVGRLRAAHTAAGLLTIVTVLLSGSLVRDLSPGGTRPLLVAGLVMAAAGAVLAAVVIRIVLRAGRTEIDRDVRPLPRYVTALPVACLVLLVLCLAHSMPVRTGFESSGAHPASWGFPILTAVQLVLSVGLAAVAVRLHHAAPRTDRGVLGGLGGPAAALLGCALGGVLTGGVAARFAGWLDPHSTLGGPGVLAGPPVLHSWQAATLPTLLCVVAVLALVVTVRTRLEGRRLTDGILGHYPDEHSRPHEVRTTHLASAVARARITDRAPGMFGTVVVSSLLLGAGAALGAGLTGATPALAVEEWPGPVAGFAALSQAVGSWTMGIGVVVLVAMGRRAYRDPAARRTVGILWDVGTFWPRAAHPFAPPCYAERAVPDLSWRMGTWVDLTGGRIVISGHSQGSVLAAAAVWQLDAPTRSRVALLTHGSPLHRLYGRWFPRYFGPTALRSLRDDLRCWRNLWRETDPIGGPVRVTGDDPPVDRGALLDPRHYGRNLLSPLPAPLLGHGDYADDPAYRRERARLHALLLGGPGAPGTDPGSASGTGPGETPGVPPSRRAAVDGDATVVPEPPGGREGGNR
ncbi:hypothetical protein LZF96_03880 [Streptomyces sp. ST2-7A]|nr:hypothetical protein [Streptomyces sp. ST2-7A]MCE7079343.1 hypothetical protein [Streptomyces sp. ST2-7A]